MGPVWQMRPRQRVWLRVQQWRREVGQQRRLRVLLGKQPGTRGQWVSRQLLLQARQVVRLC